MKKLLILLLLCAPAFAQSFYSFPPDKKFPGAQFYACAVPTTGNPCSNQATIYADQGLTTPISQPATIGPDGNFGFWFSSAQITIQVLPPFTTSYIIGGGGSSVSTATFVPGGLNAASYGVTGDGGFSFQCTYTNTSPIVTCADAHFQTDAVVGEPFFGTSLTTNGFTVSSTLTTPANATILSIDSQTQIHLNQNATASCAGGNCFGVFAQLEDSAMTTAETAALNNCQMLHLPGSNPRQDGPAVMAVLTGHFGGNTSNCAGAGGINNGVGVTGDGRTSIVIVWPTATATPCTLGLSGAACFGGIRDGALYSNFLLIGGGVSNPGAGFASKIGFEIDSVNQSYAQNLFLIAWGQNSTNGLMAGIYLRGQIRLLNVGEDQFGGVGCVIGPSSGLGYVVWNQGSCYDNGFGELFVSASSLELYSQGLSIGSTGGSTGTNAAGSFNACVNNGASWHDMNSQVGIHGTNQGLYGVTVGFCTLPSGLGGTVTASGHAFLSGTTVKGTCGGANGGALVIAGSSGGVSDLHLTGVTAEASSGCYVINNNNQSLFDGGGNVYLTNGGTLSINTGTPVYYGSSSITGTAITAAKAVLSAGWGSTAAWSALNGDNSFSGTITSSGTGQAANPTITYTFPTPYLLAPAICQATQVGGNMTGSFTTTSGPTATSVTFTYSGTPVAAQTNNVQIQCR